MLDALLFALAVFLVMLMGAAIGFLVFRPREVSVAELISIPWAFGTIGVAFACLFLNLLGLRLDGAVLAIIILGVAAVAAVAYRRSPPVKLRMPAAFGWKELFVVLLLIFAVQQFMVWSYAYPVENDGIKSWGLKAKILFQDRTFLTPDFTDPYIIHPHKHYPLLLPYTETFFYMFQGAANDEAINAIFPLYVIASIGLIYSLQRYLSPSMPRLHALLFTLALAVLPLLVLLPAGYSDIPTSLYLLGTAGFGLLWLAGRERKSLLAFAAFGCGLFFIKSEGMPLLFITVFMLFAWSILKRQAPKRGEAALLLSPFLLYAVWLLASLGLPNDDNYLQQARPDVVINNLGRLAYITISGASMLTDYELYSLLPLLFLAAVFANLGWLRDTRTGFLLSLLAMFAILVVFFYMITAHDLVWQMDNSFDRIILQLIPVAILFCSLQMEPVLWSVGAHESEKGEEQASSGYYSRKKA